MRMYFLFIALTLMWNTKSNRKQLTVRPGHDYALFFAVNDYQYMNDLRNPIQNALDIADELEENYGFEVEIVRNPTIDKIDQKLSEYTNKFAQGKFDQKGQLFLYFSGHGIFHNGNGYFMTADANPIKPQRTAMEYDHYRNLINDIPCQHILVAIDACNSASFDMNYGNRNDNRRFVRKGEKDFDRILLNHNTYKTRCFWTSDGLGNQTPDQSSFAYNLLEGIRTYSTNIGYIRSSELFSTHIEKAFPIPGGGSFGEDEPSGCFLFFKENDRIKTSPDNDFQLWDWVSKKNTIDSYRFYIETYPNGKFTENAFLQIQGLDYQNSETTNNSSVPIPEMALVKGGSYYMGSETRSEAERPVHLVELLDFYIGKYEVTNKEFIYFLNHTSYKVSIVDDLCKIGGITVYRFDACFPDYEDVIHDINIGIVRGYENHPIIGVSWFGAILYCNWLSKKHGLMPVYSIIGNSIVPEWDANGYRLPTEAEWEYAARALGKTHTWSGTSDINELYKYANLRGKEDGYPFTSPIGNFLPNSIGLYDMTGNANEWCWDWSDKEYYKYSERKNPKGPPSGKSHVLRGFSWVFDGSKAHLTSRFAGDYVGICSDVTGFRLARNFK